MMMPKTILILKNKLTVSTPEFILRLFNIVQPKKRKKSNVQANKRNKDKTAEHKQAMAANQQVRSFIFR